MSLIKTSAQIGLMRKGGKILGEILQELNTMIIPGLDVWELEESFLHLCLRNKVIPACKGYNEKGLMPPFPTGLCVSINNQAVHCIPKKGVILKDNDLITVDTVINHNGLFIDSSFAKGVGKITNSTKKLVETALNAVNETISQVKPGVKTGLLGHTMQRYVETSGFNVLRDYAGHGIGQRMHEPPEIACFGSPNQGMVLQTGMTICIESLVCEGNPTVDTVSEWETKMHDGKRFLQFEHTVLVTSKGHQVLSTSKG